MQGLEGSERDEEEEVRPGWRSALGGMALGGMALGGRGRVCLGSRWEGGMLKVVFGL